ncbi:MAG TPA: alpha/beta hydrolase [Candidatus Saccharimonadales bacterium]|nr:alpha/beta hydrolase [Candidatus Saccharimonadales bacterium]
MRWLLLPFKAIRHLYRWMWRIPRYIGLFMIFMVTISPLLAYIGLDAASRLALSDEPTVQSYKGTGTKVGRIVFLGGAGASPSAQAAGMLAMLQAEAKNVDVIEYASGKFSSKKIEDFVIARIADDEHVIFVGASLGGLLSYDIIKKLRVSGDTRKFGVVLIDAPASGSDVIGIPWILKQFSWLPLGGITNQWYHPPFDRNAPALIDPDANRQQLEALWQSYETWETSCWINQGDYVFSHDPIERLTDVTWYYIRSGADDFVGENSRSHWQNDQGPMEGGIVPEGKHIAFLNRPKLYNAEIKTGIERVAA